MTTETILCLGVFFGIFRTMALWDRAFGTYVAQPAEGHDGMTIGVAQGQDDGPTRLGWSLWFPVRK